MHNHPLRAADALRHRDVDPSVDKRLIEMFENGHSPSSALNILRFDLQQQHGADYIYVSGDKKYCPDIQYCFRYSIQERIARDWPIKSIALWGWLNIHIMILIIIDCHGTAVIGLCCKRSHLLYFNQLSGCLPIKHCYNWPKQTITSMQIYCIIMGPCIDWNYPTISIN